MNSVAAGKLPWLLSARFDVVFILGLFGLAILTGIVVSLQPALFYPILTIDLWLLGYHHVIATYTRLCFDKESYAEHKNLILLLAPAVAGVTLLVAWTVGIWVIVTVYFYWQWWHYTRQSWGVSRAYLRKDPGALVEGDRLSQAIFYAVPIFGILERSSQGHTSFIGINIKLVPVPPLVAEIAGYVAAALVVYWLYRRLLAERQGRLAKVHSLYMLTHFAIFAAAYVISRDITFGWLMINIWHNAQYILFVWMFNRRRFQSGVDARAKLLSYLSQPQRLWLYLLACISLTGAIYWAVLGTLDWLFFSGLSATIVLYQIVNFHHYIVDSLIWKVRKPKLQAVLGLPTG